MNTTLCHPISRTKQGSGFILFITLIVLLIMSLAGMALGRSIESSSVVVTNLSLRQAAVAANDRAIERAFQWLTQTPKASLTNNNASAGYLASRFPNMSDNAWLSNSDNRWSNAITVNPANSLDSKDALQNTVQYVIIRECNTTGAATIQNCVLAMPPATEGGCAEGSDCSTGAVTLDMGKRSVYYTIYARVSGPRNTSSMISGTVAIARD